MILSQIEDVGFRKDALNRRLAPRLSLHGRRNTGNGEGLGDLMNSAALQKPAINGPHDFGLLGHDLGHIILTPAISQERFVVHGDLAVREALPDTPGHVFADATGFLLRQAGHDRQQQLAFAVKVECFRITIDKTTIASHYDDMKGYVSTRHLELRAARSMTLVNDIREVIGSGFPKVAVAVSYVISDEGKNRRELLQEAIRDSHDRADMMAAAVGCKVTEKESP